MAPAARRKPRSVFIWALLGWVVVSLAVSLSLRAALGFDIYVIASAVMACLAFVLLGCSAADLVLLCRGAPQLDVGNFGARLLRSNWTIPATLLIGLALAAKYWG